MHDSETINSIATVIERLSVGELGYVYRLEGYPGLHEENSLTAPTAEELQRHTTITLEAPLDIAALRSTELFAFGMGEIVQIDDVDEVDDVLPISFKYGIVSGIGLDDEGLYYVVGLKNENGEFVDTAFEFSEDELIRLSEEEQEAQLRPRVAGKHLTLASSR